MSLSRLKLDAELKVKELEAKFWMEQSKMPVPCYRYSSVYRSSSTCLALAYDLNEQSISDQASDILAAVAQMSLRILEEVMNQIDACRQTCFVGKIRLVYLENFPLTITYSSVIPSPAVFVDQMGGACWVDTDLDLSDDKVLGSLKVDQYPWNDHKGSSIRRSAGGSHKRFKLGQGVIA